MRFSTETYLERFICSKFGLPRPAPTVLEQFFETVYKNGIPVEKRPLLREDQMRFYQTFLSDKIYGLVEQKVIPGYLLSVPMGMGKTAATLTAIKRIWEKLPHWKFIIVAPLEVAKNTWPDEIAAWEHLKDLPYAVCCGTAEDRERALKKDVPILIINRDNLQWLWNKIGGAIGWRWHMLIYDESSRLKGFTRRTPSFKRVDGKKTKTEQNLTEFGVISQARAIVKRVVELTGTPAGNGIIDLGGQICVIDRGKRLAPNKTRYHKRFFDINTFTHSIKPKDGAEEEIMESIKDVMIGLCAEDYIDMPKQLFNFIPVNFSKSLMDQYKQFERDMVSLEYDVEAVNRGVLRNKLLQFANGGLYRQDPDNPEAERETVSVHDLKLRKLASIFEEAAGESVLVAYSFKFDKLRIKQRFPKVVFFDEEPNFIKKWNRGEIEFGASHPASIGHGLNLQWGGHIQAWYGLTQSREIWDQFNRRLARPGQTRPVNIHVLVAQGTADEIVLETIEANGVVQDRINDAVRIDPLHLRNALKIN